MRCESGRFSRKRASQVGGSATNLSEQGEGTGATGSPVLGNPGLKSDQATFPPPPVLLPRRVLGKAVEAFVRELREGGVQVEDRSARGTTGIDGLAVNRMIKSEQIEEN